MDRRQPQLLAHVHPAVEAECEVERVEHEIARGRIEIAEFSREPGREARPQELAQLHDAETDGRRHRAHALGEVPYRQPLLEQFGPVGDQKVDAVAVAGAAVSTGVPPSKARLTARSKAAA